MTESRVETGTIPGGRIDEDLVLYGMASGDVLLSPGRTLVLHGMVTGDLTIEAGARVFLHGTVGGSVRNHGEIEIHGRIEGQLDTMHGHALVVSGSVVAGKTQP